MFQGVFEDPRKLWPLVGLLAALALGAWLLASWLMPKPRADDTLGPPRSSYTAYDFVLDGLNDDGSYAYRVTAPKADRREADLSMYVDAPIYFLPGDGESGDWNGFSNYGWISNDGTLAKLQGTAHMQRTATATVPWAKIDTSDATLWPKQQIMQTKQPAHVQQPDGSTQGVGMHADLKAKQVQLLAQVHSTFLPKQHHAQ